MKFESYVISYGSEPVDDITFGKSGFESYVISYGSERAVYIKLIAHWFESYVVVKLDV